ncbi:hypothetical protein WA1_51745 [Scytonema hofmannii PCC 7110]|jgi:hypothetical protein|uniref:Uncharacterized protein n=1 Tax=Scytonema hofmannii PCC 7110 TaxID=128403 RepID=A0A139WPV5_9CYAN|nr:hypothetical protein [Scytonema hofmannii]KYC34457.1 hypothetical protein WA1_51745 [Scytonema hofmannii PCC 7110]
MIYELISEEDYESLPDDPEGQFIALESICRRNMTKLITRETTGAFDSMVRLQYMSTVSAAAEELGLPSLYAYHAFEDPTDAFNDFIMSANSLATKIRLRKAGSNNYNSVRLGVKTRGRIEQEIAKLRNIVINSNLDREDKGLILKKLDELSSEIGRTRVSFSKVMAILAYVGMGVGGTTAFIADAPDAIATIASLLGADKEAENKEAKRLGLERSIKSLPPPKVTSQSESYDDEIPF